MVVQAKSTDAQIRQVFFQMQRCGSINRYEAAAIGVCALPPRVRELKDLGLCFRHRDEQNVADEHGILHHRIRRYFIDWEKMTPEAVKIFAGWGDDNDKK
ncbi:helix-turn-helix domain-containing protein [Shewanella algae]|uniref:Winged helix-turn-helix domain-containing protein n=1 Tax=Shewanella algae TaxID=38313 RepID=A0AAD1KEJ0_9GAMM|nr:helix-turn-helix domain-containing protein [Shewanella algae]BCV46117.1 hypothetical protein TUM17379_31350 [Shewanella algae]